MVGKKLSVYPIPLRAHFLFFLGMLSNETWFNTGILWPEKFIKSLKLAAPRVLNILWLSELSKLAPFSECCSVTLRLFNGSAPSKMYFDKLSFHRPDLIMYSRVKISDHTEAEECSPTKQSKGKSEHIASSRGSLPSKYTLSFS